MATESTDISVSRLTARTLSLVSAICFLLALVGCTAHTEQDPRTQPELVRVVTVAGTAGGDSSFTGVVTARIQSDLGFRVAGKVTERLVNVGQTVKAGQPL